MLRNTEFFASSARTLFILLGLAFVLVLHGAIPGIAMPVLGQSVWTAGFAQSFVNDSIFSIYATNFGAPHPAAISFGLAGAYPAGLFIALGLHPSDAYAAMVALWLSVAFFGAWRIGAMLEVRSVLATLLAVLWLGLPIVWRHAGYSMVSLGIALLPFYFWAALRLLRRAPASRGEAARSVALYLAACLISVFMDGYTFVMFATGATLLGAFALFRQAGIRRHLLTVALPVHIAGFAGAYLLYTAYIGQWTFSAYSMDITRGFGVDLGFMLIPTEGVHWLWDTLGLSISRERLQFFGDASTWVTTFSIPLILAGTLCWFLTRRTVNLSTGFFLLALFGVYMALGPSLKIHSTRPPAMIETMKEAGHLRSPMPANLAVAPTGNAILYRYVPGIKVMRAAYRWLALGLLGFWLLTACACGRLTYIRSRLLAGTAMVGLIVVFLPHLEAKWHRAEAAREAFLMIDRQLVSSLEPLVDEGEMIAFLPYRNDFLVNYLASRLEIRTYNIGGDKNLRIARRYWPESMQHFKKGQVRPTFAGNVLRVLLTGHADAVVIPYIDMLSAAHIWPAPAKYKDNLRPFVRTLKHCPIVAVADRPYYALVRLESQRYVQATAAGASSTVHELLAGECGQSFTSRHSAQQQAL